MGFGDSVTALLDTYANCLKLLKAFNGGKADRDRAGEARLLRSSIKSDRAKIHRAYSSRRSVAGSRFEKGDRPARSALRRVLKRLKAAIANLLNFTKNPNPVLDCESLTLLSNASRIDTINAFDQLSRRLSTGSSRSSVSSSSSKSTRHRRKPSASSLESSSSDSTASRPRATQPPPSPRKRSPEPVSPTKTHSGSSHRAERASSSSHEPSGGGSGSGRRNSQAATGSSRTAVENRLSLLSISTDSTKLGEIPARKLRRRYDYEGSVDEYNVPVTYPLKPYRPPEDKGRGFWSMFRRS